MAIENDGFDANYPASDPVNTSEYVCSSCRKHLQYSPLPHLAAQAVWIHRDGSDLCLDAKVIWWPGEAVNVRSINWRKSAEYKVEDLRQLLIQLDFLIQEDSPTACRATLCKIEATTQNIRNILASENVFHCPCEIGKPAECLEHGLGHGD